MTHNQEKLNTHLKMNQKVANQDEQHDHTGMSTPPLPPRAYSLSSSLDKFDDLENIKLQDLGNQSQMKDQSPKVHVNDENTYQPLIPPRCSKNTTCTTGSEYQSLT